MSTHFGANQYEDAFRPNRLQNYELSSEYREHPPAHRGSTRIISNDRGHIIHPNRRSAESPWGNYLGTWDLGRQRGPKFTNPTAIRQKTPAPVIDDVPDEECDLPVPTSARSGKSVLSATAATPQPSSPLPISPVASPECLAPISPSRPRSVELA